MYLRKDDAADLIERFNAAVEMHGNDPAVEFDGRIWSYRELDRWSDVLANGVRGHGVHSGRVVVIDCEREPLLVSAALACVKARSVFFVVGENLPETYVARAVEDIDDILWLGAKGYSDDAKARRICGERVTACRLFDCHEIDDSNCDDAQAEGPPTAGDRREDGGKPRGMYLVATSGTTGRPKLVHTGARPVVNFIDWYQDTFSLSSSDKFSMLSGLGYDPLIRDIFTPLCLGACISIPERQVLARRFGVRAWIGERRVSVVHATPQLAQVIFDRDGPGPLDSLRVVALGGAPLTRGLAAQVKAQIGRGSLVNMYGTTETPQAMTYHRVDDIAGGVLDAAAGGIVPLGKPIREVSVRIVDTDGESCGSGNVGEIHILTPHLSMGYYGDSHSTGAKFSYCKVHRCASYRTGDLGFVDGNGDLNFVGRRDRQVKLRGYRVQLEEIEQAVQELDGVLAAAVVHERAAGAEKIHCYVQFRPGIEPRIAHIKRQLLASQPAYMVPDSYVSVVNMPLNSSNKIDYKALPQAAAITDTGHRAQAAAAAKDRCVAEELLSIWSQVLGISAANIALNSNFFDVGGNSLLCVQLVDCINKRLQKKLTITDLFVYSNINDLSDYIACAGTASDRTARLSNVSRRADRLSRMKMDNVKRMRSQI